MAKWSRRQETFSSETSFSKRERERVRERERKRERERGLIVYLNPHTSIEYLFHVRKLTGVAM